MIQKRWLVSLLLLALVGVAAVAGASPNQQAENAIPPKVVETIPFEGEEILLDQAITLYFDQVMDQASVEEALSLVGGQIGDLTWADDLTLVITPQGEWERAAEISLEIGTSATTLDGTPFLDPFELEFQAVGYLEVTEVIPAPDQAEVIGDSLITIIFNRPVVPLVTLDEQADLPSPLTLSPNVEGKGEWLNTSIYVFRPDVGLGGGLEYTASVAAGLTDATGAVLREDYTWSFRTLQPEIVEARPLVSNQEIVPLDSGFMMEFSQAMNPDTTNEAFKIVNLRNQQAVSGETSWSEDGKRLTFKPSDLLELDTEYAITIDTEVATSAFGAILRNNWESTFITVPYPDIFDTVPTNGATNTQPYGGFQILFNAPIDSSTVEDKITIDPEPWRDFDSYFYSYNNSYQMYFDTEPSTTYTITIEPGIADPYGNTILDRKVITYTTGDYEPEINLNVPSYVGLYSAYNPNTRVFATHRNVSRLNLELYDLDLPTLSQLLGDNSWEFRQNWSFVQLDLLRSWSLDVQSQPNQRRYELLLLSSQGGSGVQNNVQCLGAPDTQMQRGDVGVVSSDDPRPLRVRSLPNLQGNILAELQPGITFDVLDGPICADGFLWWYISAYDEANTTGWSAEGTTDNYFMEMSERQGGEVIQGDVNPEDYPALDPGIYYLTMTAPETSRLGYSPIEHVALIANVNITFKESPDRLLAWVTDLETGQPVTDTPVNFYDDTYALVGTMNTNADGVAFLEIPRRAAIWDSMMAVVDTGELFGLSNSRFDEGIAPWRFNVNGDYEPEQQTIYLYTDRPLYRPDQPVYFRGVIRDRNDVTLTVPQNLRTVPVNVTDPEGQVVYSADLELTPHGTFSGEFTLDLEAALGYYRIEVPFETQGYRYYGVGFNVGEYVPPEFSTVVTPSVEQVTQGETIEIEVESTYFFGGSVTDALVAWSVLSADYIFQADTKEYYDFSDFNYDEGPGEYYGTYGREVSSGEGRTDSEGKFIISIPADLGTRPISQEYTIEARVVDESDYLVAGRTTVIIHQGEIYVGARPERYVSRAGAESAIKVLAVDWDSEPIANQEVEYRVVDRVWSSVQEEDELGRTIWTWDLQENEVDGGTGTVTTDENGQARITFVPPGAGTYKVYLNTTDSKGNEIKTSTFMWVSGSQYVAWRQQNSDRFDLITDAQEYNVGDTAEILIASPFQGDVTALVTVERGSILSHEVIQMTTNSEVFRLPIEENFAPNVFVSVILVKGVDENNAYAQFRMGLAQLNVNPERYVMNVEVTPDVPEGEFVGPGDTVTYQVKTTDWEGKPVSAEVGISVTDLSVLSIASPNSGTLMDHFYAQRSISVKTNTPLTVSVDRTTQTIIDTIKGGGGGGAESGIFDIREEFVDTPGWEPSLVTDENGEGTYSLTLPDNLTVWRLDARAITAGSSDSPMLVGQTTTDVQSTKPLLVRPLTPRFLIVDDLVSLGMIVNNNTGETQSVEVTLEGTGFMPAEGVELTQVVDIPAGNRQRVNWDVRILDVPSIDLTFYASGNDGQFTDASKPTATQGDPIPVYKYEAQEFVGTGGTLNSDETVQSELISLPRRFDVTQGELTIQVDRSLAAATTEGLDYLKNYPYQCTEQTVSRFLPNVMTARALEQLSLFDPELKANLDEQVNFGIQRLYATQHVNGGWGWFFETRTDPLVTAYALIGLVEARNSGYSIDQQVINRAAEYLQKEVADFSSRETRRSYWNRQTFLVYALTRAGFQQASRASLLYDNRERLYIDAKAYLAITLDQLNPDDTRAQTLMSDFVSEAVLSATGAHWEDDPDPWFWTTDTRSTALVLQAMIRLNPENELIPQVVRWLMVARQGDAWETTQETAWAVMALTDWMVASGELRPDYTFSVTLNSSPLLENETASPENVNDSEILRVQVADLLKDEANRLSLIRSEGQGNLYYTAHLQAFLPVPEIDPVNSRGLILERKYYSIDPNDRSYSDKPITGGMAGEDVGVVLTIIVPNDLYYVVIEDPIPAGSAAVDPNLLTNSVLSESEFSRLDSYYGWGWWWFGRKEFRDEKVVLYSDYLPRGTYELRYTLRLGLAGEYNVIPPTGYEFYFPEVFGRGAGSSFVIAPSAE